MVNDKQILQEGLFTRDPQEVERMVNRVTAFNLRNLTSPIKLDVMPYEEGDYICPDPHVKFRFLFPHRGILRAFWSESY